MSKDNNDRKQCELSAMIRTSIKTLPKNRVNFYHKKLGGGNCGNILRHNPLLPTLLKLGFIRLGKSVFSLRYHENTLLFLSFKMFISSFFIKALKNSFSKACMSAGKSGFFFC